MIWRNFGGGDLGHFATFRKRSDHFHGLFTQATDPSTPLLADGAPLPEYVF